MPSNHELFERSKAVIPGGVNSSIRAFRSVGGEPYVVESAALFVSPACDVWCVRVHVGGR